MKRLILKTLALALLSCQLLAADSLNIRSVGVWSYGPCRAVSGGWIGGHRYAVTGSGQRLQVLNIDDPAQPCMTGDLSLADDIYRLWVDGDRAYVAYNRTSLAIVDLADPSRPECLGTLATGDRVCGVARTGQLLAMACRTAGLVLVNIADPLRPALTGQCPLPGPAMDVAIDGGRAYVACGSAGLRAVDISTPSSPQETGHCDLEGSSLGIQLRGRHAYLSGTKGLAIVSIDSLVLTVRCPVVPAVPQVQLYQGFAVLPDVNFGIRVIEIDDLADIGQAGYCQLQYTACQLSVLDNMALVADSLAGLRILDLTALHHWTTTNLWSGNDTCYAVELYQALGATIQDTVGYAMLAAGHDGMQIFKLSDSLPPVKISSYIPGGRIYQSSRTSHSSGYWPLTDQQYCLAAGDAGLIVIDLRDPAAPRELSRIVTPGPAINVSMTAYFRPLPDTVFIGGDTITVDTLKLAAVACGDSNVWYYSINDSGVAAALGPVKRGHPVFNVSADSVVTRSSGGGQLGEYSGIRPIDTLLQFPLWGSRSTGGYVRRNACGGNPVPVGDTLIDLDQAMRIVLPDTVSGGIGLFIACDGRHGLHLFRGSVGYGHCATPGFCMDVAVNKSLALVADGPAGLQVVDISQSNEISELGVQRMALSACAVAGDSGQTFITGSDTSLWTIDLSDSSRPLTRSVMRLPRPGFGLAVRESLLLVADGDSGLQVCALADPDQPAILGHCGLPGYALAVTSQGNLAAVAADSGGLSLVDLGDPRHPALLGRYDTPGTALGVALDSARQLAVVADGLAGVEVIDISDPAHPALLGNYDTEGLAYDVALRGTQAMVADGTAGLVVLDISDPAHPAKLGNLRTGGCARQLAARDSVVYLADGECGLSVINIAEPGHPAEVGNYRPGRPVWAVARYGDCLLALDDAAALRVLWPYWTARQPYVAPAAVVLRFENRPNPFGSSTAVVYQLTKPGAVSVALYNIQGQLVKVLVSGVQAAGSYRLEWDGKGSDGRMLASGVYLGRLSANGRERYHKVVLLR